ncbi:MAG: AraC family transcriptional regulator [Myxococcaceae bacterium]|nr:AraC family transcriptional regulator [Myxococcaceae bacterium]
MNTNDTTPYTEGIGRAVAHLARTLDEAVELDALAREAAFSPFYFHRIFRGLVGETPVELHRRLRLERAATQLVNGAAPVTRIAFDAGYETHESFTRAFKAAYGSSPTEFRALGAEACGPRIALPAQSGVHFGVKHTPSFVNVDAQLDVAVDEQPSLRLATLRHSGPYFRISETFGKLGEVAGPLGLFQKPGTVMLAVFHDDPETTPANELRSDAALSLAKGDAMPKGLTELVLRPGRYARLTHEGPYEGLPDKWLRLIGQWLPRSGHRLADAPSYELYRNPPSEGMPTKPVTDLYVPLA